MKSREETEFFRHGEGKNSVSRLQDGANEKQGRDRVFQAWRRKKTRSLACRTEPLKSREEGEFFGYGEGEKTKCLA